MHLDESAILWSAPERERAQRPLLVLMHGFGSHEGDLFAMSPGLPLAPVIASIRAPIAQGGGWAWFPFGVSAGEPNPVDVDDAARAIIAWLDGLEYTSVSLLGFSQGAAMALQLLRHAPTRFAATVTLSGFVVGSEHPGDGELAAARPKVFWGRGTNDLVIPSTAIDRTALWLEGHADATTRIYEELGHSISPEELRDFVGFLAENT